MNKIMENQKFYIGNYKEEAKLRKGWFVGHFMDNDLRKRKEFEVKEEERFYPEPLEDQVFFKKLGK